MPQWFPKQVSSRPGANTNITMSGASQQTASFGAQTYQIRLATGAQPAFVLIGQNPTADTNSPQIGANVVDYWTVTPGQKAAVLQAGTAGVISITEMQ
jgi:hypothetical protein